MREVIDKLELNPIEKIHLCLTKNHVEYIPEDNEVLIFNKLKETINNMKITYEEKICHDTITDELIVMSLIF